MDGPIPGQGSQAEVRGDDRRPGHGPDFDDFDPATTAVAIVLGFGSGAMCRDLCYILGPTGFVLCYEPDLDRLRGVLERIDHSEWMGAGNFRLVTTADRGAISDAVGGDLSISLMGVRIMRCPGRETLDADEFLTNALEVWQHNKMQIQTVFGLAEISMGNELANMMRYVGCGGIKDLEGVLA